MRRLPPPDRQSPAMTCRVAVRPLGMYIQPTHARQKYTSYHDRMIDVDKMHAAVAMAFVGAAAEKSGRKFPYDSLQHSRDVYRFIAGSIGCLVARRRSTALGSLSLMNETSPRPV
jgi:hypothetical protein